MYPYKATHFENRKSILHFIGLVCHRHTRVVENRHTVAPQFL